MRANIKLVSLSIAALCVMSPWADASPDSVIQNNMLNGSNIFVVGGVVPSKALNPSESSDYLTFSPYLQMAQLVSNASQTYQSFNYAGVGNYNLSMGIISLYGVNFYNFQQNQGPSDQGIGYDLSDLQWNISNFGQDNAGPSIYLGQCGGEIYGSTPPSCSQSFANTVNSVPSLQITEIKPDFQTTIGGETYDDPPIYHIIIQSGSFKQSIYQQSNVAPAYYLDFNNGTPFNGSDRGGFAIEPVSITGTTVDSSDEAYQLSSVDVYYHGNLPNVLLEQNFNDLYPMGPTAGTQSGATMTAVQQALPTGSVTTGSTPPATLTIVLNPGQLPSSPSPYVAANGMNQELFQVQLQFTYGSEDQYTYYISPTDPKYGWLYNDLYFVNGDGTLVNNFYLNGGGASISETAGPYTTYITPPSSPHAISGPAATGPQGGCSGYCPKTYYFSSTQVGSFPISAMLDLRPDLGIDLISAPFTFSAQPVSFSPSTWSSKSSTLTYNQDLAAPSTNNEAVYLNLDHTSLPVYVGFSNYESLSSNTYCANATITNGFSYTHKYYGTVSGESLSFELNCDYDNSNPDITTNAVDQYGDYDLAVGFGN